MPNQARSRSPEAVAAHLRFTHGAWWASSPTGAIVRLPDGAVDNNLLLPRVARELHERGFFGEDSKNAFHATVVPVSACNLACPYCIQNTGAPPAGRRSRPARIPARAMSDETVRATAAFIRRRMAEQEKDELHLVLFGGEPLLRPDLCLRLLDAGACLGLRNALLVTNGLGLTRDLAVSLADAGLRSVQVTLDGDRGEHDRLRVRPGGGATFDEILERLAGAQDVGFDIMVRVNVNAQNRASLFRMIDRLRSDVNSAKFQIEFIPVDDIGVGFNQVVDHGDGDVSLWCSLYSEAHAAGFAVRPKSRAQCVFCEHPQSEAGIVINSDGQLYSCWDALGREELSLGTVQEGYRSAEQCSDRWRCCGYGAVHSPDDRRRFWDLVNDHIIELLIAQHSRTRRPVQHVPVKVAPILS